MNPPLLIEGGAMPTIVIEWPEIRSWLPRIAGSDPNIRLQVSCPITATEAPESQRPYSSVNQRPENGVAPSMSK